MGSATRRRSAAAVIAVGLAGSAALAACASGGSATRTAIRPAPMPVLTAKPPGPHGGVSLRVLVLSDGTLAVRAIRRQLTTEGIPSTVISLRGSGAITTGFLTRRLPGGGRGGNFDGVVLPSASPAGLSAASSAALASYERKFGVRQVDAYEPPSAALGMQAPAYSGPLRGRVAVTARGAKAGFGYLRRSFAFSGGAAGPPAYGYLASPIPGGGARTLVSGTVPGSTVPGSTVPGSTVPGSTVPGSTARGSTARGALVWRFSSGGRQQLGVGFGYAADSPQFRFLAPGIVSWLTRGVQLGYWRGYLTVDYDDVINADARWSVTAHCTPGGGSCPPGTPETAPIRMKPADVSFAVRWQRRHRFEMEFLYNGGPSARFRVRGTDPLLAAFRPVAGDFYWVNHTFLHANLGCKQDFSVQPWRCVRSGGRIVWASRSLIDSEITRNLDWAKDNGIPVVPGVLATGEYSGLRILPQQPADNPNLVAATGQEGIRWIALDASRDPRMRPVGTALGVPRHPIDVGYDVETIAEEVNEYNWFHTSKADGGSGICERSENTACLRPLSPKTGWQSFILPAAERIVFAEVMNNDPRPFFLHQSNLTGDRLGYPVMDGVLTAYRSVFSPAAPLLNLDMAGDGAALREQQIWSRALRSGTIRAWVQGRTLTITGPPGVRAPVTVPPGTVTGAPSRAFGSGYGGQRSGTILLGKNPVTLTLPSAPYR